MQEVVSNERVFDLPGIDDYTDEQKEIEYLPLKGLYLVLGGPGTGKSVVALSRARLLARKKIRDDDIEYNFVVFNVMLDHSSKQLYPQVDSVRWIGWFNRMLIKQFSIHPDYYKQSKALGDYNWSEIENLFYVKNLIKDHTKIIEDKFDVNALLNEIAEDSIDDSEPLYGYYNSILKGVSKNNEKPNHNLAKNVFKKIISSICNDDNFYPLESTYLVIDEGQDLPPGFYNFLMSLGCENLFVAADQNQQVSEFNSDIDDLKDILSIDKPKYLTENFRQKNGGYYVARLAQEFHCDQATPMLELPEMNSSTEVSLLISYSAMSKWSFELICQKIFTFCSNRPNKLIAIITPNNDTRIKYYKELDAIIKTNSEGVLLLTTYFSGIKTNMIENMRFDRGGIMIINAQSCKGLEFDTVFLADVNNFKVHENSDVTKKLFYVMVSRAKEKVIMLRDLTNISCPVEDEGVLPKSNTVLKRISIDR